MFWTGAFGFRMPVLEANSDGDGAVPATHPDTSTRSGDDLRKTRTLYALLPGRAEIA